MASMTLPHWFIKIISKYIFFYSLCSSTSHSKQLRSWVMWRTAQLKYFECFPWNLLKDAADRTWHGKCMLSLPKMCCIISFFQHEELKRKTKNGKEREGKELHVVTGHPGWKIIFILIPFWSFHTWHIKLFVWGEGKRPNVNLVSNYSVFEGNVPSSC